MKGILTAIYNWFVSIGETERIHWLGTKDTFKEVVDTVPLSEVQEGDAFFLCKEHECACCEEHLGHIDQRIDLYEPTIPDHGVGNNRYIAVVKDGEWVKAKLPWRNY